MIGVVVWTDQSLEKAVIWCEDHSDLAYYVRSDETGSAPGSAEGSGCPQGDFPADICKGDLVLFDAYYDGDCRMARNVRLVQEESHPMLAECLRPDGGEKRAKTAVVVPDWSGSEEADDMAAARAEQGAQVVPFLRSDLPIGARGRSVKRNSG